jgi:RNA polymerase sigma-70 factor (ECF subfamily)
MMPAGEPAQPVPRPAPAAPRSADLDRETLLACARGEPAAFRAFVVRYERLVFALLGRMVGRGPHVEDLAQETFLRAFRAFATFHPDGPAKVTTWLLTIATRLAIDERRKRAPHLELDGDEAAPEATGPERELLRSELRDQIEQAALGLSAEQRAVFLLCDVHGATMAEAAEIVGIVEATVKTRLFRARARMRARLEEGSHGT